MKKYKIDSDGINKITYEDDLCTIIINVADFRDTCWWIAQTAAYDKRINKDCRVTNKQQVFLFKRIAYDCKQEEVFNEKLGFIKAKEYDISKDEISIMEVV